MPGGVIGAIIGYFEQRKWNKDALEKYTTKFLPPSQFMADTCINGGYKKEKFEVLCNFIDVDKVANPSFDKQPYYCYLGRVTEVKGIRPIKYVGGNDLSFYTYLKDCSYQVRAHFEWNLNRPELECDRNEHKHHNIARRMIERGGRRDIFLGTRECQGYAELCVFGTGEGAYDNAGEIPYSLMLHGFTYADEAENKDDKGMLTVRFWQPVMKNGVIDFLPPKDCTIKRHIKEMEIKPFGQEHGNFSGMNEPELDLLGGDDRD